MIGLVLAAAMGAAGSTAEFRTMTDGQFCAIGRQVVASLQGKLPMRAGSVTQTERIAMICDQRTMQTDRRISVDVSEMASGWEEAKLAQWSAITCRNPLFNVMAHKGWRFTHTMIFRSGERVTQEADCSAFPLGGTQK